MKANRDIIIRPLVTEKISDLQEKERKVAFVVALDANKIEIRKAVEKRFNVKVEKVATANFLGKMKKVRQFAGRRPDYKKAIVTLKEGFKIEFFEGR